MNNFTKNIKDRCYSVIVILKIVIIIENFLDYKHFPNIDKQIIAVALL